MALSKPVSTLTPQHFLVCGIKNCDCNCQFYCNDCHQQMCKKCKEEHQKSPETGIHKVVPFLQRKRQLHEVKCQIHLNRYVDMLCEQCQVSACSKCATQYHGGHSFLDLETVYAEKCEIYLDKITKIEEYFLPTSQDLLKSTRLDSTEIKKTMESTRTSMKAEAEYLKNMVDNVTSKNIEQVNKQELSLLQLLDSQEKKYHDYNSYLSELLKKFYSYLSSQDLEALINESSMNLKINPIPETTKPVPSVFTASQFSEKDVTKLLGKLTVPKIKPENRKIMETVPIHWKPTMKHLSLSSSVTKVTEYAISGLNGVWHISIGKSGRIWVSDNDGKLVKRNNQLQIRTSGRNEGYHAVTQDGDLIYTDKAVKVINRMTQNNTITGFIKTGDWRPLSIHSSRINGDILVGMVRDKEAKVTRFNKTGKEIQNIQRDNKGQALYSEPHYITENINGDVCTSDINKQAVVVVKKSGQNRFSYTGQRSTFHPSGICNDLLGHIIVCDGYFRNDTIDILDQDGQFLSLLLTPQQWDGSPRSVCVDDENNLLVGEWNTNTVSVYKYLQ